MTADMDIAVCLASNRKPDMVSYGRSLVPLVVVAYYHADISSTIVPY